MKIKQIIITATLLLSVATFAQKEELKTLKKLTSKDLVQGADLITYKDAVSKLETTATEEADKNALSYYKGLIPVLEIAALGNGATGVQISKVLNTSKIETSVTAFNKLLEAEKAGKKVFTDKAIEAIEKLKPSLLSYADYLFEQKQVAQSSDVLYSLYLLSKQADILYYAASYAANAEQYDKALQYYDALKKLNYTGESTTYYAKSIITNSEESFDSKEVRDRMIALKTHNSPREEKNPSKKSEILKNYALILVKQGKTEEAKKAITQARTENPNDTELLITEANFYLDLKDFDRYSVLVKEALVKNPNDKDMLYNLGVISGSANKNEDAEKYYKKAIEIDPTYADAYINLSELLLRKDKAIVDEMNKLGTSEKDNKRYDVLTANRKVLFNNVLPVIEKAYELKPNSDVKATLMSVYKFLEMNDKVKELKSK